MAWSLQKSLFLKELSAPSIVWMAVLIGPFIFVGVMAWRSRQGFAPAAIFAALSVLLAGIPYACFDENFGEGCQNILVLSPIYLWAVVAIAALLEIFTRRQLP